MEGPHPVGADPRQIARIAAVVAANDQHEVEALLIEQRQHGILPLLRRAADRVERPEVVRERVAIPVGHGLAEHLANRQRFRHQHGRLVGAAHTDQVLVGIESG